MSADDLHVLIIEDDDDDALLIRECLAEMPFDGGVEAVHARDVEDALGLLGEDDFDVLLVDYQLGPEDGVSFLERARSQGVDAPAVFLTGQGDQEVAVRAMKAGATDYLVKAKLAPAMLAAAVRYAVEIHRSRRLREQAEIALQQSEERYRRVFSQALTGNYIATPGGQITACNEAFARMLGFDSVEQAMTVPAYSLHPDPSRREIFLEVLQREGRLEQHETALVRRDGETTHVIENVVAVRDAVGRIVELQGSLLDVTRRKRAEAALRLRDRAIEAISQGLLITDATLPDNPVIHANPGFQRITGYSVHEVLGRNCRFMQGPETDPDTRRRIREAVVAGQPISAEVLNYRKDGSPFWNYVSITPIRDAAGRVTHFVGLQTDVTERKQLEEQFRQAQKMEAVGRLAGGVAHDFNNLLGVILGYGQMALRKLDDGGPQRRNLEQIVRAAERAASLTRQLLAYSRRQILEPELLDLNVVVGDMKGMLGRLIGEDIEVQTLLAPDVATVRADPGQMEQLVMNLAVNARDAMPDGGRLSIETSNVLLDGTQAGAFDGIIAGRYVRLSVVDTGHGMSAEARAHAFEPFFTTKKAGEGTGLGLATVYGVVKQSGGHVTLQSEPGRGTRFDVYLPAAVAGSESRAEPPLTGGAAGGGETLLVVEDEDSLRGLVCELLEELGYRVHAAATGDTAIEFARGHPGEIHLLVTDVVLSGMSGRETARRVSELCPNIPVLYMSGYTDDTIVRHGVLEPGVSFLPKPFTSDSLARAVRRILDATPGGEGATTA